MQNSKSIDRQVTEALDSATCIRGLVESFGGGEGTQPWGQATADARGTFETSQAASLIIRKDNLMNYRESSSL
jgi:hypothetical protein